MDQEMKSQFASNEARHVVVGIDVAKLKLDVACRSAGGKWRTRVVANTPRGFEELLAFLDKQGASCAHVCMEATGIYWEAVAAFLADRGFAVSVMNPAQIKAFGESNGVRTKTDKVDARVIGEFCADRNPAMWQPPTKAVRRLRALVSRREALIDLKTQETNRLEVTAMEAVKNSIQSVITHLEKQIGEIERQIKQDINDDPTLKEQRELLNSIPGVGDTTIAMLLSHYGGELRFGKTRQAVAFAGLDTQKRESGTSLKGKPRMSKMGNCQIRRGLYMPAVVAMTKTAWGQVFSSRLLAAGKPKMLILGALMRKLVSIAYGVLKSGKPFDPALHALT